MSVRVRPALIGVVAVALGAGVWQASIGFAAGSSAPAPNPLAPSPIAMLAPVPGVDITGAGPASAIHGDPLAGAAMFRTNCASCHGPSGTQGISNPGSDDGVVPTLNPIDPGFIEDSNGDAAIFARELDHFVQHGSRPAGKSPLISMPGFGDHQILKQSDIADIEAYVMQLNGTFWPDRCPGLQLDLANPTPGSRVEVGRYIVEGRAVDVRAQQGAGVDRVDFFLDGRDTGGRFVGTATVGTAATSDPSHFQATLSLPNLVGGHTLVAYARSAVTGHEAVVSVAIALGEDPSKAMVSGEGAPASLVCIP